MLFGVSRDRKLRKVRCQRSFFGSRVTWCHDHDHPASPYVTKLSRQCLCVAVHCEQFHFPFLSPLWFMTSTVCSLTGPPTHYILLPSYVILVESFATHALLPPSLASPLRSSPLRDKPRLNSSPLHHTASFRSFWMVLFSFPGTTGPLTKLFSQQKDRLPTLQTRSDGSRWIQEEKRFFLKLKLKFFHQLALPANA